MGVHEEKYRGAGRNSQFIVVGNSILRFVNVLY